MPPFPLSPPSLSLPIHSPHHFFPLPPSCSSSSSFTLSPFRSNFKPHPPSFIPFSSSSPPHSPFPSSPPHSPFPSSPPHYQYPNPNPNQEDDYDDFDGGDHVIGDCLVFEDGAFEEPAPPLPGLTPSPATPAAEPENLVPDKWKEAVEEIRLSKKERRKISHQLRFASKMERRPKSPMPSLEEYEAYRELKLSQLKPVVLDDPKDFPPPPPPEAAVSGGRVPAINPRLGMREGGFEDITEFFNSGEYVPGELLDDKKPQGPRKLFTKEERVLLNKRIPNLTEAASSKWLPLHTLAASGEFYLLDALLKHNVDINAIDKDGLSAIHKAILCKKQAIINYLLRNSANPSLRDRDGATLIHYAVQTASSQTIKILLLYNVDINLADDDGWTPLHLAVQTKRTDIVRLLLIKGADRTLKNRDGLTPLDLCLYSGRDTRTYELIKLLKGLPISMSVS